MVDDAKFRGGFTSLELCSRIPAEERPGLRLLDVGGGNGVHTNFFRSKGFQVDLVDILPGSPSRLFVGNFLDFLPACRYDIVWASHILEHILNPGLFIDKLISCGKEGGWLCVIVPPYKSQATFGHVTLWNAGTLLINLIKAGLDCRNAVVQTYGYNVSVLTPIKFRGSASFSDCLPPGAGYSAGYFKGEIASINCSFKTIPHDARINGVEDLPLDKIVDTLSGTGKSGFVLAKQANNPGPRFYWWDDAFSRLVLVS